MQDRCWLFQLLIWLCHLSSLTVTCVRWEATEGTVSFDRTQWWQNSYQKHCGCTLEGICYLPSSWSREWPWCRVWTLFPWTLQNGWQDIWSLLEQQAGPQSTCEPQLEGGSWGTQKDEKDGTGEKTGDLLSQLIRQSRYGVWLLLTLLEMNLV